MNIQKIITRSALLLLLWVTFAVPPTFSQTRNLSLIVDFPSSTRATVFGDFLDFGAFTNYGFEATYQGDAAGSRGGISFRPDPASIQITPDTRFLIEATIGEFNESDYRFVVFERNIGVSDETFSYQVLAADFIDDGRAVVSLSDRFFNGNTVDGIPNGTLSQLNFESTFDGVDDVDITIHRIYVFNPILGDANQDGVVDFSDIQAFIFVLSSGDFQVEADCNEDGAVDFSDIQAFIAILSAG